MRVLMTCQPAFSHATQLIPLARKLSRDGHSAVVATSASFAPVLARHGIDVRTFDPDWMIGPGDRVYDRTVGQHLFLGFPQVPDRSSIDRVLELARDWRADLIVREYSEFTGWVVARKLGVPLVTHGIIHRLQPQTEDGVAELAGLAELAGVDPPRDRDDLLGTAYLDIVPPVVSVPMGARPAASPSHPPLVVRRPSAAGRAGVARRLGPQPPAGVREPGKRLQPVLVPVADRTRGAHRTGRRRARDHGRHRPR